MNNNIFKLTNLLTKFSQIIIKFIFFILLIVNFLNLVNAEDKTLITINQFVSHPALDAARLGLEEAFKKRYLSDNIDLKISNAQGNIAINAQISKHQAALLPKFMIAIATPSAQSIFKNMPSSSILAFIAVTDPEAAGIVYGSNVIGVSDIPPIKELLETTLQIIPKARNIGIIYNQGEINSTKMVERIKIIANEKNLQVIEAALTNSSNAKQATQKLIGKVDFIYIPQDNLVVSSLDSIIAVANKANIPLISNDPSLNEKGLLLSYGCDYFQSGEQLGNMIADVIEGKELTENIQSSNIKELKINHPIAEKLSINIPAGIK